MSLGSRSIPVDTLVHIKDLVRTVRGRSGDRGVELRQIARVMQCSPETVKKVLEQDY